MRAVLTIETQSLGSSVDIESSGEKSTLSVRIPKIDIATATEENASTVAVSAVTNRIDQVLTDSEVVKDAEVEVLRHAVNLVTKQGTSSQSAGVSFGGLGGGGCVRLTDSAYRKLTYKDNTTIYLVTDDDDVLQEMYVGEERICQRNDNGTFDYTFPFTLG